MKIQCDVCNRDEASVFCSADEAALCNSCDHRVHHANKLAEKHHRFSLLNPPPKQSPLCDICQEKRAFLFCQQDRAILCRDCDIPIHKANEHTQNHNRFLLTGVKLSATSAIYSPSSSSSDTISSHDVVPNFKSPYMANKPVSVSAIPNPPPPRIPNLHDKGGGGGGQYQSTVIIEDGRGSTISEYLIEVLPGWHVEDLLDSSPAAFGLCKTVDENVMSPFWDSEIESNLTCFSSQNMGIWVPQQATLPQNTYTSSTNMALGGQTGFKEATNMKSSRKWRDDGGYTVPQISPPSTASKRCRNFW